MAVTHLLGRTFFVSPESTRTRNIVNLTGSLYNLPDFHRLTSFHVNSVALRIFLMQHMGQPLSEGFLIEKVPRMPVQSCFGGTRKTSLLALEHLIPPVLNTEYRTKHQKYRFGRNHTKYSVASLRNLHKQNVVRFHVQLVNNKKVIANISLPLPPPSKKRKKK